MSLLGYLFFSVMQRYHDSVLKARNRVKVRREPRPQEVKKKINDLKKEGNRT
jgi:hypothetical protein